jgi:hypothetical protein
VLLACGRFFQDHIRCICQDHLRHASCDRCRYIFAVSQEPKTGEHGMLTSMQESFTSTYWRHPAEETRNIIDQMTNDALRKSMLAVARHYDRLAELTEKMERSPKLPR